MEFSHTDGGKSRRPKFHAIDFLRSYRVCLSSLHKTASCTLNLAACAFRTICPKGAVCMLHIVANKLNGDGTLIIVFADISETSGIIIGLMQNVVVLGVEKTLGGSSGYCTVVSQWVVTKRLQDLFPTLAKARRNKQNWWQVLYWGAAVVGAMCSAMASDTFATAKGVTIECAIFGGILMVFGSRCAAGCTSGHGLSGFALLQWLSFIAVPCMFGGGIVVGFIMQATGALCQWDYHDYHVPIHDDTFC